MQTLLRLCLWQVLIISISCFSLPIFADDGIRIRGPQSTDAFPYDRYGPIVGKDTLWNIALQVRPESGLSVYQVMQALYENNADSFKNKNLNHMISGQYLKIPSIAAMRAINPEGAQQKSLSDDKAWQKKALKVAPNKVRLLAETSVNKKDLDDAKSEINVQLQAIDSSQQQRFATIENDVLDSIDGLQSLLKENEALRQRLTIFTDQLGVMQNEVAKSKGIKVQMDDMISLQQALLAKAEAREQALLLEKQKADFEEGSLMSSTWFVVLMATLPAILVLSFLAFLYRRKARTSGENAVPTKKETIVEPTNKPINEQESKSVDDELALDEWLFDDELSRDLSENDEGNDDLFSNDLDDLDEIEDISLDDDTVEGEALEGGQLDQADLDFLFAGLEDEPSTDDDTRLDSDQIDQSELDNLLAESAESTKNESTASDNTETPNEPEDVDALLDTVSENISEVSAPENTASEATSEVSSTDDIDALEDSINDQSDTSAANNQKVQDTAAEETNEVSAPDDIDALVDSINDQSDTSATNNQKVQDTAAEETNEVSAPDDIDALEDSINDESNTSATNNQKVQDTAAEEETNEVSAPDEIDALEDSINDQTDTSATNNQKVQDTAAEENNEISDPDDIDALLDAIKDTGEEVSSEISDPDDIDALLDSINDTDEDGSSEISDPDDIDALLDAINDTDEDGSSEISNPDDIDALLDAINDTDEDGSSEISDPDATASNPATALASEDISNDDIATSAPSDNENIARINNFTDEYVQSFLGTDFSEQLNESADEAKVVEPQKSTNTESQTDTESQTENSTANNEEISDDFDIDTLIDEVNQTPEASDAPLDIGDDILDTTLFDKEFDNESDKEFDNEFDSELVSDLLSEKTENKAAEQASSATDEENLPASPGDFDESTLANLLNDEKDSDDRVELSADFTDSNVLADLLSGNDDTAPSAAKSTTKSNAEEVNGMKELDNLDFDDLLANIEEESSQPAGDNVEVNDDFDLGDDLDIGDDLETVKEDIALTKDNSDNKTVDKDFISVDSLLFNSLSDGEPSEPYEKMNIDVGLSEFPEFSGNVSEDDTDDDNGIAAKLDLAKVYLEMGDDDNAEVILLDVIKQGDAQQQFDAQQLLDKLKD